MSKNDDYPAGVPCWIDTFQPDPEAAARFYERLFGWEFAEAEPIAGGPGGRYPCASTTPMRRSKRRCRSARRSSWRRWTRPAFAAP